MSNEHKTVFAALVGQETQIWYRNEAKHDKGKF